MAPARDRDANSSRQNDVINLMRFFAGETSRSLALSFPFAAENKKSTAREKISARLVGKSTQCRADQLFAEAIN